jgi:hypothetical protein
MANGEQAEASWRGWHVIGRFLPMTFLGLLFVLYGLSPVAPHEQGYNIGIIFVLVGLILMVGSVVGMLFTKCPTCYHSNWIYCVQEPDVKRQRDRWGHYYARDLADGEKKG